MIKYYVIAADKTQMGAWAQSVGVNLADCKIIDDSEIVDRNTFSNPLRQLVVLRGYDACKPGESLTTERREIYAHAISCYCQARHVHGISETVYC